MQPLGARLPCRLPLRTALIDIVTLLIVVTSATLPALVTHGSRILICYQAQTNLNARLISVHSLSGTSLLNVPISTMLETNRVSLVYSLAELFETVVICNVLVFIKETHFCNK